MVIKNMPGLQRDWARKVRGQARCSSNSELDESVLTCGVHSGTNLSSLKGRGIVSPDFTFPTETNVVLSSPSQAPGICCI